MSMINDMMEYDNNDMWMMWVHWPGNAIGQSPPSDTRVSTGVTNRLTFPWNWTYIWGIIIIRYYENARICHFSIHYHMIIMMLKTCFWPGSPESKQGVPLWVLVSLRAALPSPCFPSWRACALSERTDSCLPAVCSCRARLAGGVMVMSGGRRWRLYFWNTHVSNAALINSMIMWILRSGGVFIMVVSLSVHVCPDSALECRLKRVPKHDADSYCIQCSHSNTVNHAVSYCPAFGYKPMLWFNVNTMCSLQRGC